MSNLIIIQHSMHDTVTSDLSHASIGIGSKVGVLITD